MQDHGIGTWVERHASIAPDHPAIVSAGRVRSYGDLAARVRRLAHGLRDRGVARGDRVAWLGSNHPAFLETLFATAKLGAILAPINHRLRSDLVTSMLVDCSPQAIVLGGLSDALPLPSSIRTRIGVEGFSGLAERYEDVVANSSAQLIDEPVGLSDLCMLPYTSGTTGAPKGVMLTHGNLTWNVFNLLSAADFRSGDTTIALAPFFRVGGTGVNVLPVLFKGGTVLVPPATTPELVLRSMQDFRVTVGFGNPDLLADLVSSPLWPEVDLSSVRFVITGGAPVPERLIRTFLDRGVPLLQGYGLSEAAPVALLLDPDSALRKVGAAGKPPLFVDVRMIRPDGSTCRDGETGELLLSGPNVMPGYWNRSDATKRALDSDGWLHTGDAARRDADGDVWIVDRMGDRFLALGEVVYPGDVERVLLMHPAVVDAGVVGIQRDGSSSAAAFVVRRQSDATTEEAMLAFAREHLAAHQVPSSITFVEALPRSSVGKLLRQELPAHLRLD